MEEEPPGETLVEIAPGGRADFEMRIVAICKTTLERQILESILIERKKTDIKINSKSEWNAQRIPRIFLEIGEVIKGREDCWNKRKSNAASLTPHASIPPVL